jgi:pimeloyl-ACP methyl ester carboxylesterase
MTNVANAATKSQIYQAQWDATDRHLDDTPTTWQKVGRVFWNVLSVLIPVIGLCRLAAYGIGHLAKKMILPSAWVWKKEEVEEKICQFEQDWEERSPEPLSWHSVDGKKLKERYRLESHQIRTPDGAELSVRLFRAKEQPSEGSPPLATVIQFNVNGGLAEDTSFPTVLTAAWKAGVSRCNLVRFNYRGTGGSSGSFEATKDLVVDGSSVLKWVLSYLKTPKNQIHFMGRSLGGAIAAQVQALDPDLNGRHLNDRSLASINGMVAGAAQMVFGDGVLKKIFSVFARPVAWIVSNQGYGFDAAAAFDKLKGQRLIVYHPKDEVIPYEEASLHRAVSTLKKPEEELNLKEFQTNNSLHHNASLSDYQVHSKWTAEDFVVRFLFSGLTPSNLQASLSGGARVSA